jgi:hypothetical protein
VIVHPNGSVEEVTSRLQNLVAEKQMEEMMVEVVQENSNLRLAFCSNIPDRGSACDVISFPYWQTICHREYNQNFSLLVQDDYSLACGRDFIAILQQ